MISPKNLLPSISHHTPSWQLTITVCVCRPLTWITERVRDGKPRQRFQEFEFEDGTVLTLPPAGPPPPPTPGHKGLFARDMELFFAEIRGQRSREEMAEDKKRILACLELAEEIEKMASV